MDEPYIPTAAEKEMFLLVDMEESIKDAKDGDPFPYIELQWPRFFLDDFQRDIVEHVFRPDHKEVFVKGCTKPGKGFSVALAANIWFDVFSDAKIILVGPNAKHSQDVMFAEIAALRAQMAHKRPGEVLTKEIRTSGKHYITISNPKSGEGFSGQHGPHTMFIFDEASDVDDKFYTIAKTQARFIIALSNPRTLSGWFRDGYKGAADPDVTQSITTDFGRRRLVTVGAKDCYNVRHKLLEVPFGPPGGIVINGHKYEVGEPIPVDDFKKVKLRIPAQLDYARYKSIMSDPNEWNRRVFGEGKFPKQDAAVQLIMAEWLDRHLAAWNPEEMEVTAFGLDVAASEHGDESVFTAGNFNGIIGIHSAQYSDTTDVVGWALSTAREEYGVDLTREDIPIAVDMGGVGKGPGDTLRDKGCNVIDVLGNRRPRNRPQNFYNEWAEAYGELAERLDPRLSHPPFGLPNDQKMLADLTVQQKIIQTDGVRFKLLPKDKHNPKYNGPTIRGMLGRSPDRGDSVALCYLAARRSEYGVDTTDRPMVYDVEDEPEDKRKNYIQSLCQRLDGMDEGFSRYF